MKSQFLGTSTKKFTCNPQVDLKILVEDLKSWPHRLTVFGIQRGEWVMPFDGRKWAIYAIPISLTSLYAFFGWDGPKFSKFCEETEPKFAVEVVYEDGKTEKVEVTDGREILTPEKFPLWAENIVKTIEWPVAIESALLCISDADVLDRAEGILEQFIKTKVKKSKFLDFGCGDGSVVQKATEFGAEMAIGYDIVEGENAWKNQHGFLLTTDFSEVQKHAPYDIISLYDVLDHAENPVEILKQVAELAKGTTLIKTRCHPWTARHGGHLYKQLNKAYAHLVFTKEELAKQGYSIEYFPTKVTAPLGIYKRWFLEANLQIVKQDIIKDVIPDMFRYSYIKNVILKNNQMNDETYPQLEIDFIDYQLSI
jgi:2-polyprenyl-3-methyl-5-hydroxy-6-metoxy-1,4-benzoquinol methylase